MLPYSLNHSFIHYSFIHAYIICHVTSNSPHSLSVSFPRYHIFNLCCCSYLCFKCMSNTHTCISITSCTGPQSNTSFLTNTTSQHRHRHIYMYLQMQPQTLQHHIDMQIDDGDFLWWCVQWWYMLLTPMHDVRCTFQVLTWWVWALTLCVCVCVSA